MDIDDESTLYMRKELFLRIAQQPGMAAMPDQTWASYIFDKKFVDHRHERTFFRSQHRSALSTLYEILTDEERRRIFTGDFDIGSGRNVPLELQTYAALERALEQNPESGDSVLKPIKRAIQSILGSPVKQYLESDPSVTLKVLKLLYRYQKRTPQLFSFLKMPGPKRPSFEFNDAYATREATEKQRIIDELTVHLGSELGTQQRELIRSTFMALAYDVGVVENRLKIRLKRGASGSIERYRRACADTLERLDHLRSIYGTRRKAQRLDVDLLIYLNRAQIENRNKAYAEVTSAIEQTELPVRTIEAEVIRLNARFDRGRQGRDINVTVAHVSEIGVFLNEWSSDLQKAMSCAFGKSVTDIQYESAQKNAQRIVRADPAFMLGFNHLGLLDVLALLCVAHFSVEHQSSFRYKPYWHGQKNQSDRPFYPLKRQKPIERKDFPEGRAVYWRVCYLKCKYALLGQLAYWALDLQIATCINNCISQVMESHDIDAMQGFLSALVVFPESI